MGYRRFAPKTYLPTLVFAGPSFVIKEAGNPEAARRAASLFTRILH
jgi:hypothetical protein